ncbi:hypothetical protein IFR05_002625 [Cadophora sp. M221]|nr:hypothetical protein IFR05_002625 [Cadophora sp. M221]
MTLLAFKKVKQRLNRPKGNVPPPNGGDPPPQYKNSEVANASSLEKPTAASTEVQSPDPVKNPATVASPKISKYQSKTMLEVTIEPCYIAEPVEFINEKSIPQWRWPNTHVRAWLIAVLINDMNFSVDNAIEIADIEMGIGANLYCRTEVYWMRILDADLGGKMYVKLLGMRGKEGAVPDFCHVRKRK